MLHVEALSNCDASCNLKRARWSGDDSFLVFGAKVYVSGRTYSPDGICVSPVSPFSIPAAPIAPSGAQWADWNPTQ